MEGFDDIKIRINNSDESRAGGYSGEKTDYSKLVFTEGIPTSAECIGVKRAEKPEWNKPGETKPVARFLFRLLDDNGVSCVLSKDCNLSVTFGSKMKSHLYKTLKGLFPNAPELEFQDEGMLKARLADIYTAEGKDISIPCMIIIKKGKTGFVSVDQVFPEPSRKIKASPAEKKADPASTGFESQDDFDKDEIPFK